MKNSKRKNVMPERTYHVGLRERALAIYEVVATSRREALAIAKRRKIAALSRLANGKPFIRRAA